MKYLLVIIFLTGCGVLEQRPQPPSTVEVRVPIAVPCIDSLPIRPDFITDAQLKVLNDYQFVTALHVDRMQRDIYESKLEALLTACTTEPTNLGEQHGSTKETSN